MPSLGQNVQPSTSSTFSAGTMRAASSGSTHRASVKPTRCHISMFWRKSSTCCGQGQHEEVADLTKVGRMSGLELEVFEHPHRHALQPYVGFHRELLPHTAGAFAGRLRAEGLALEEDDVDVPLRKLVGEGATHDAAAHDDYISAYHASRTRRLRARSSPCPTPRRSALARRGW